MKRFVLIVFTFLPAFSISSFAQNITGIWRGYFITDDGDQYSFEVQIEQNKNVLSGVTYSYMDKRFYGKCTMTGNFSKSSSNALIQEIKTVEVRMALSDVACIQKCRLTYSKSGKEEFLEGTFSSVYEKTDTIYGKKRGGDCGGGSMYLRKVPTSDFYVEPFLRKKNSPVNNNPPLVKNNPATNNSATKITPKTQPNTTPKKTIPTNSNKSTVLVKPKTDSVKKVDIEPANSGDKNLAIKPNSKTQDLLRSRENDLMKTLIINSETVSVKLYDNGQIDNDTISVYLDKKLILSKKRLSAVPLIIDLKMDEANPDHELIMVAENLGEIPPNTSLMIVTAGDKRYEVRITSTEQKNAMVRFRYVKNTAPLPLP
jgi:hypothetical protein